MKNTRGFIVLILGIFLISSCADDGKNSLVDLLEEPAGDNCALGGVKIISGLDENENNVLDEAEVQNTEYVCNGENGGQDHTLLIQFPTGGASSNSTEGNIYETLSIKNFNITDYQNIDSIVFSAYLASDSINNNCLVELYDITNDVSILNTLITSNSQEKEWVTTNMNFLDDLPNETIDLGIRIWTETEGTMAECSIPVLVLFRE